MTQKIITICMIVFLFSGCTIGESSPSRGADLPTDFASESEKSFLDENDKIGKEDISITLKREKVNIAYEDLNLSITNNSLYPLAWYAEYNIYEEIDGEYLLVDDDGDGMTKVRRNSDWQQLIQPGETVGASVFLWKIRDKDYARPGKYRLEIPINAACMISLDFEVVNEYIPVDTDISIQAGKEQYSAKDKDLFYYTIVNNSEQKLPVTLDVNIARYKNGAWERLPKSKKYTEMYYWANMYSESVAVGNTKKQEFTLTLSGMVGKKLTPGKYRLEKNIKGDWFFYEFEVVKG